MNPGVNANRNRSTVATDVSNGRALNFGVSQTASVSLSKESASVSGSFGLTGVTALLVALVGLWALDRYVLPIAGAK